MKPRVIDGTSEASAPFWSPDSKTIGFFSRHALKKVPAQGGRDLYARRVAGFRRVPWRELEPVRHDLIGDIRQGPL